jgi:hypothetical protein
MSKVCAISRGRIYRSEAMGIIRAVVALCSVALALLLPARAFAANPLQLVPAAPTVAPRQRQVFVASGGAGSYHFTLRSNPSGATIGQGSGVYVAGSTPDVTDIVEVSDASGATVDVFVTVGLGVTVSPANPSTLTLGMISFTATGGSGSGYSWRLVGNSSGGRVDTGTGNYVAGPVANVVDRVEVTDSLGNTAATNITIGARLDMKLSATTTPPRGSLEPSASGGTLPYAWSLVANASGATIDPATGAYHAGAIPNVVDRIQVKDGAGATLEASINVGPGVAVSPQSVSIAAGVTLAFSVNGGSGTGYTWSIQTSTTGGKVSDAGIYVAGPARGTDVVVVKDSLGNTATAQVTVLPAQSAGFGSDVEQIPVSSIPDDTTQLEGGGGCALGRRAPSGTGALGLGFGLSVVTLVVRRRSRRARGPRSCGVY